MDSWIRVLTMRELESEVRSTNGNILTPERPTEHAVNGVSSLLDALGDTFLFYFLFMSFCSAPGQTLRWTLHSLANK